MNNIRFIDEDHKGFYLHMLASSRKRDCYHRAFFYLMGLTADTRRHIDSLFDVADDSIKPEGLSAAWQTSGSKRVCLLAFNLWNGWVEEGEERSCTPEELFCTDLAPYFVESIRLRYPEYMQRDNTDEE